MEINKSDESFEGKLLRCLLVSAAADLFDVPQETTDGLKKVLSPEKGLSFLAVS